MNKIVTGCIDCPFSDEMDMAIGYSCNMDIQNPKRAIKEHKKKFQPITPDWCPLKTGPVVVLINEYEKSTNT